MNKLVSLGVLLTYHLLSFSSIKVSECSNFDFEENKLLMSRFISAGDLVFDVGAHEGKKAQVYLDLGAHVVCFEPQPECVDVLNSKFYLNPNICIEQVGLGEYDDIIDFYQCSQASTISTFSYEYTQKGRFVEQKHSWDKSIKVPITTLESMIKKYGIPTYCKIDVENFEYQVLKGLKTPIRYISFECNTEWIENAAKCVKYLTALGYTKFNFAVGERNWFLFSEWRDGEFFMNSLEIASKDPSWNECWGLWGDVYASYE